MQVLGLERKKRVRSLCPGAPPSASLRLPSPSGCPAGLGSAFWLGGPSQPETLSTGPGRVTHFFLSCPSRQKPPRKPHLGHRKARGHTQQATNGVAAAGRHCRLRATRSASMAWALRARAPAASLRMSHARMRSGGRASSSVSSGGQRCGRWVEAEREGGGVWRRRGVEVAEGQRP